MLKIDRERVKTSLPFLVKLVHWLKRRKNELSALPRHLQRRAAQRKNAKVNGGIIKVVFLCQYIPAWSKNKQLYESLNNDPRFEATLLCVPNRISANKLRDPDDMSNDTYEYFIAHGYIDAVNALVGKNEWFDLRAQHPDYVICNRYDRPMPVPYTSDELSKYVKICFISYSGVPLLRVEESLYDRHFISNTFFFFADSNSARAEVLHWNRILYKLKIISIVCCGIPAIENVYLAKNAPCESWDFSNNSFRAIYAPRWTEDRTWGGTSFLKYNDTFFHVADMHPEISILVRPHPLMFDHLLSVGLMTEEDITAFKGKCNARPNIQLDESKEYHSTFWNSSVLICDFSSFIVEYFVTEKPIVYLTYDDNIEYTELMQAILSGCYLVSNEQELIHILEDLESGIDPLADRRAEVCKKYILGSANISVSKNMKQFLFDRRND